MLDSKAAHINYKVAVLGNGSWGTALVKVLSENKHSVYWYMRSKEDTEFVREHKRNKKYLTDVSFSKKYVSVTTKPEKAVTDADFVLIAVPAAFCEEVLSSIPAQLWENKIIISAVKGILPESGLTVTEWLNQNRGVELERMAVIGGPCHAEEVALERQSFLTIASDSLQTANKVCSLIRNEYLSCSPNTDPIGVEYCAIMKNIVAIAAGIAHGYGYGDNFQAVLVSNAMLEIERFLTAAFPKKRNLLQSGYLGDLLVTAYSQFSRNRTFGNMIGRGYSVNSAQMEMNMIAEGYYAVKGIHSFVQMKHPNLLNQMPILSATYALLYEKASLQTELNKLKTIFS